ncbi:MAG: hypothetical protein HN849_15020 [Victivallales bacterium]|nr:hypothetical protein [Victivallales bacterium]
MPVRPNSRQTGPTSSGDLKIPRRGAAPDERENVKQLFTKYSDSLYKGGWAYDRVQESPDQMD